MSTESYRAGTGISEPGLIGLPRTFTSERVVAPETQLPVRGAVLGDVWGPVYKDNIVIDAQDVARGGQRYHVVVHCSPPDWVVLYGSTRDSTLNASVGYRQQVVPTPTEAETKADPYSEFTPVTEALSIKRTLVPPIAALNAFWQKFPTRYNFPGGLPRVLKSAAIVWHEDSSTGSHASEWEGEATGISRSLSGQEAGSANSSASVVPELVPVIEEIEASGIPSESNYFFLPMPVTSAQILSKVGATAWPVFKPKTVTIVLKGMKVAVQASASASAAASTSDDLVTGSRDLSQGSGQSYDTSPTINSVTLPATIHGAIAISNTTPRSRTASATADVGWTGVGGFPSATATSSASLNATGSVSPTTIPATTPSAIPASGIYLVDARVEPYDWGYARVFAETIDATNLA